MLQKLLKYNNGFRKLGYDKSSETFTSNKDIKLYDTEIKNFSFCFSAHAAELGNTVPTDPVIFLKPTTSYITQGDDIRVCKILFQTYIKKKLFFCIIKY